MDATPDTIRAAVNHAQHKGKSGQFPLVNGGTFRVEIVVDEHTHLNDEDWFGRIAGVPLDRRRPKGFDGSARKFNTRSGQVWWQPPTDVVNDPGSLLRLAERVEAYFLEQWYYVGVSVTVWSAPCPHCHEQKETEASLWGIDSDAGNDHFEGVVADLLSDLTNL